MGLLFTGFLNALLLLTLTARADDSERDVSTNCSVVSLGADLTLQAGYGCTELVVQDDGFIYFELNVPEPEDGFFSRHHLHINLPYFSSGYRKNHYIEVTEAGSVPVRIPSDEPAGTPVYLYDGEQGFIRSAAERIITPVAQFFAVSQLLNFVGHFGGAPPYRPSIDFKHGAFLEGIQGYVILDSSLRLAREATEYLEIYYQINPGRSSMTVVIIFATGAMMLRGVPIDTERFDALAMQKSFIYSGIAGKVVDAADELLVTPGISEKWFPSHSSVRGFRSKLTSQIIRGPVVSAALSKLDMLNDNGGEFISPANWLITKKLMIKSASDTRQFNEFMGQNLEGVPGRLAEWGLNGLTVAVSGIDGPTGSLKQTFTEEFQQQLGSHGHKQLKEYKDKQLNGPLMKTQPQVHLVTQQIFMDFAIGGLIYFTADKINIKMSGNDMIARRVGKGAGLSYALRTVGACAIEWISSCATNFVHDYVSEIIPSMAAFFRRDYLLVIDHGITPQSVPGPASGVRSDAIHDEL